MVVACPIGGTDDQGDPAMLRPLAQRRVLGSGLLAIGWLLGGAPAQATWTSGTASDGIGWSVRNGRVQDGAVEIKMPDQKTADRTADKLNKAEDKAEKRAEREENRSGGGEQPNGGEQQN